MLPCAPTVGRFCPARLSADAGTAITTQTPQRPAWGGLSRVSRLSYIAGMAETCRPESSHGNQMARTPIATSTTPTVWPNGFP